ncbi:MAG TPA: hypothetical protein VFX02_02800 [Gammaproteobacteria bacterium]|nr:hypothetical protein [Gammaproteobacteria bacterium]
MKRNPLLLLCVLVLAMPFPAWAGDVRVIKSFEYKGLDGPLRVQDGLVVLSQADSSGNTHNALLLDPANGDARRVVESVPGARFVAEDDRYVVYSFLDSAGNRLAVRGKGGKEPLSSLEFKRPVQWGHIDGDRLIVTLSVPPYTAETTAQVYSLPSLQLEKSVAIAGGSDTALWENKIVSVGLHLGIYSFDLDRIATVDMPLRDPGRQACNGGSLRITGDKAVVATDCGRLLVVDLPSARIERMIQAGTVLPSFDVSEGVIFAAVPDSAAREVRAIDLASGIELARLPIDTDFMAMRGNRMLGMKKPERFGDPARFTLYALDTATIKSETARLARLQEGCGAAQRALDRDGDLYAAIEACEESGIRGFIQSPQLAPEARKVIGVYAIWLARSLSRYDAGSALLERLISEQADDSYAAELANARRKATYLDPPDKQQNALPAAGAAPAAGAMKDPPGVMSVPVDFGGYSNPVAFEGDRIYIGRWLCNGQQRGYRGVVLDVFDRKSFQLARRVDIAACDFAYQDTIDSITAVPGYVVLGMNFRMSRQKRPDVVVLDDQSLAVKASDYITPGVAQLRRWHDTLLACGADFKRGRFDPETARIVDASPAETAACEKGGPELRSSIMANSALMPVVETAHFRAEYVQGGQEFSYRIASLKNAAKTVATLKPRPYTELSPVTGRDALVMSYEEGPYRRFMLYEMAARKESALFELKTAGRLVTSTVQDDFLFVALGRDLMVYDLARRMTVKYEKDFLKAPASGGRNGIVRFIFDEGRLIAPTLDGSGSRVIDLDAYLAELPGRDFFAP